MWLKLPAIRSKLFQRQFAAFLLNLPAQVVDPQLLAWNRTQLGCRRFRFIRGAARDQDRREHVGVFEDLLGVAKVHDGFDPGQFAEEPPQRFAVAGLHPLVGHDERQSAAGLQQPQAQLVEVHVQVGHAVVGPVGRFQVRLDRLQQFLPDVRRIGNDDVEPAGAEHFGKTPLPRERSGIDRRIGDDAVPRADRAVQAGQRLAAMGRLDPQAQPADLDRLVVQIHAVQVVLQDPLVEIQQRPVHTQFFEPVVGSLIFGVQPVKGLNQECAAAAGRIQQPNPCQLVLPAFPKLDQRRPLRLVELVQCVDRWIGQHAAARAARRVVLLLPPALKTIPQHAAQGLLDDVARDERRRVERAFLLPPRFRLGHAVQLVPQSLQVGDRLFEDVAQNIHVDQRALARRDGRLMRRPVVVVAQVAEVTADLVRDLQAVQARIRREQPAVVGVDAQRRIAAVDGLEQAAKVVVDGARVVRIAVLVRFLNGVHGQQPAILGERAEQDAVQQFLRVRQHDLGRHLGIVLAQA